MGVGGFDNPEGKPGGRPRSIDVRAVVNAIFYLLRTGCQWRLLPREFPPWPTVYYYFRRWEQESVWLTLLRSL
jgi:putative transposase